MSERSPTSDSDPTEAKDRLYPFSTETLQTAFYLLLLGWTGWLLAVANTWDGDDKLFPFVVGVPLGSLTVAKLVKLHYRPRGSSDADEADDTESVVGDEVDGSSRPVAVRQRYELTMLLWVIALPVASYYLGLALVIPAFIFSFLLYYRRDVKLAAAVTVAGSVGLYLLFVVLLDVSLWEGTLDVAPAVLP